MALANRAVILNSTLRYILNSIRKYPANIVKTIVMDFYSPDNISTAKDILVSDISNAGLNIKAPPKCRINDRKLKLDIEDILSLINAVDEANELDKLSIYATHNLDELPVTRMDTGGLSIVIAKLDKINDKLSGQPCSGLDARVHNKLDQANSARPSMFSTGDMGDGMAWGDVGDSIGSDPFNLVQGKKRRRGGSDHAGQASGADAPMLPTGNMVSAPYRSALLQQTTSVSKPRRIIGRSNNNEMLAKLKSSKPYAKKAIYGIYNVGADETVDSVSAFVTELCGVNPINCFVVAKKTTDNDNKDTPIAFRICIDAQYSDKFLDPMAWANGIVIKPWKFKPKPKEPQADNLTTRNGSSH